MAIILVFLRQIKKKITPVGRYRNTSTGKNWNVVPGDFQQQALEVGTCLSWRHLYDHSSKSNQATQNLGLRLHNGYLPVSHARKMLGQMQGNIKFACNEERRAS